MDWKTHVWQKKTLLTVCLWPISYVFYFLSFLRKHFLKAQAIKSNLPVIVVGNISVGGNGKTPVLIALAHYLTKQGYKVGIVSRGYKAKATCFPVWCDSNSDPLLCGDEPVMIAKQTQLSVVVDPCRSRAVLALSKKSGFDIILSDDGLQHYKMGRTFEIAVIGSKAALGNHHLLPAGPLREPISRLKSVDWVIGDKNLPYVDYGIEIEPIGFYSVNSAKEVSLEWIKKHKICVITGIALPERFHEQLKCMGLAFSMNNFPDHYHFKQGDFSAHSKELILMTEKDAVKCSHMSLENAYYLKIKINLDTDFLSNVLKKLRSIV